MTKYNFHNKTFALIENSESGAAGAQTIFKYQQEDELVTADYYGGTIRYGKIIARLENNHLHMLYQCMTTDGELKAGKALAKISLESGNKIKLNLNWEWLGDQKETGVSEYLEV